MKKAVAAAVLLALLFGAAAWNIAHIDSLTGSLTASADEALAHCRAEDYDAAEASLREAIERWYGAENYTHMFRFAEPYVCPALLFFAASQLMRRRKTA